MGLGHIGITQVVIITACTIGLHVAAIDLIYPKLVASRVQLNPLAASLGLLLWAWLWGAIGLLFAIPITAALKIIFDHVDRLRGLGTWLGLDLPATERGRL